ncbi:unnamed protein product [Aspergillus oryzae RIB40]|uniref:DNA, SC023 n=1 Tax=Aspergillus oryzae (strain ATCC 42149 / RIB 40) TaxID=510516 RepID=Q2UHZ7_ASPOR|nr:unnamed protein product [Aspergillus oryzae RIB40]BAE58818.1 unnamed protein product [Aspergillus oryzae RIB40]
MLFRKIIDYIIKFINDKISLWIRLLKSSVEAPILFIFKKNSGLKLYINYRGLNKITIKNRYLLFLILEILDRLAGVKFFIKINIQDKIAFYTRYNHFKYLIVFFVLYNILNICYIVYLDNILIFLLDRESYIRYIK